jgi:hypothetical protein
MSTQDTITKIKAKIESRPGYKYNAAVLADIINGGTINPGTIVYHGTDEYGVYYPDRLAKVRHKDLTETASVPMTPVIFAQCLESFAACESQEAAKISRARRRSL